MAENDNTKQMILKHFCYIVHDPKISKSRKMLTIEQFQNPKLKELQTKQNYTDVMRYFTGLVRFLLSRKKAFRKRRGNHGGPVLPSGYRVDKPLRP